MIMNTNKGKKKKRKKSSIILHLCLMVIWFENDHLIRKTERKNWSYFKTIPFFKVNIFRLSIRLRSCLDAYFCSKRNHCSNIKSIYSFPNKAALLFNIGVKLCLNYYSFFFPIIIIKIFDYLIEFQNILTPTLIICIKL